MGIGNTSREHRELLATHKITQSLSRPGQCWDNAVAESFFATLKVFLEGLSDALTGNEPAWMPVGARHARA